ncbi:MAG: HAMP domain-containing sensor histidine kinase, partial [Propionicimonas sp.]|nr:HAMP domain-containing sensor histidine kinase [Propionicimonas sp.]
LQSAVKGGPGYGQTRPGDPEGSGLIRLEGSSNDAGSVWGVVQAPDALTTDAASDLWAEATSGEPRTIQVEGLGLYRVLVVERANRTSLVALPFNEVTDPLARQLVMAGMLTVGAIALSFIFARQLVESSLRPLNRLAATATKVAGLPLESGEGNLPVRVDARDTDPRSEVGQVGTAFNHMLDHVENALAVRHRSETKVRRFVADASHELRNPLAAIRGYAELTRRGEDDLPEDTTHALSRIESESDRMSDLVEDLLLLARLDSEPTLALQPTDVTEIVLNAVDDARAAGGDHSWGLDLPEDALFAVADPQRLHQVVVNLLANARVHTPPGTRVVTSLRREGAQVVIRVNDNGPGVPPEIRDTVFERFTRAEASRVRHEGGSSTGLGLAIVAAVVAAHGGTVSLDSRPGATTFAIGIPAA